jgi:two-component system, chemotaxis family, CheB/CheR fusion protein
MSANALVSPTYETPRSMPNLNEKNRKRVLVVDDSPDIADMLAVVLRFAGYETVATYSALDALRLASEQHFDAIVSDIGMPGMNGYELAQTLRGLTEYRVIPMLAVTGFDIYDDRKRLAEAGFNTHLRKPINPVVLTQEISQLLH